MSTLRPASGSRTGLTLFALTAGLTAAGAVAAFSYLLFGSGTVGPPQTAKGAALRYAHLLRQSDGRGMEAVVCRGADSHLDTLGGVSWRLERSQTGPATSSFALATLDGTRHLRITAQQAPAGWCIADVVAS